MAQQFPAPYQHLENQNYFMGNEVGLNHPLRDSHVRLHDNGDVEITAGDGLSMIFHAAQRQIVFVADQVKFLTKEDDGLRWNRLSFNKDAYQYQQPTFFQKVDAEDPTMRGLYRGANHYTKNKQERNDKAEKDKEPTQ